MARAAVTGLITDEEVHTGKLHIIAAVAGDATRRFRSLLPAKTVPAHQVILLRRGMTIPTQVHHLGVAWRGSSEATVAGRAGRGLRVPVYHQITSVNALSVQLELIGGNVIGCHALFVGMTLGAGSRQLPRMDS